YKKDMTRYKLKLGFEISQELYDEIIKDTVFRRAKQKALAILKYMDRTEYELRNKLSDSGYNPIIIEQTIDYINSYNYLDDTRYTRNYINFKKFNMSKRQIEYNLYKKGISKEVLQKVINEIYDNHANKLTDDPEIIAINKAIKKKIKVLENMTYEEEKKIISFLYRKGFNIDKIKISMNKVRKEN
ncbi:MAG TPA: hypothetical protein GXZ90_04750, partial [Clostridiales bacterium]|nr:hypothetical protein [Clostridiales bacterium]